MDDGGLLPDLLGLGGVLFAAGLAAWAAIWGVRRQIQADTEREREARFLEDRRNLYARTVTSIIDSNVQDKSMARVVADLASAGVADWHTLKGDPRAAVQAVEDRRTAASWEALEVVSELRLMAPTEVVSAYFAVVKDPGLLTKFVAAARADLGRPPLDLK